MNIGNNENHKMTNESDCLIDYDKYLQCPKCKESKLYCNLHKIEVDKILNQTSNHERVSDNFQHYNQS